MNDEDDREEDVETCQKVNHGSDFWDVCPMRAQRVNSFQFKICMCHEEGGVLMSARQGQGSFTFIWDPAGLTKVTTFEITVSVEYGFDLFRGI